jgi:excisionase family DNA binding protein
MRLEEAAALIPCTPRWLANQIRAKRIPARKIGGHWRMTEGDVEAALEAFSNSPVEPADEIETPRLGLTVAAARRRAS